MAVPAVYLPDVRLLRRVRAGELLALELLLAEQGSVLHAFYVLALGDPTEAAIATRVVLEHVAARAARFDERAGLAAQVFAVAFAYGPRLDAGDTAHGTIPAAARARVVAALAPGDAVASERAAHHASALEGTAAASGCGAGGVAGRSAHERPSARAVEPAAPWRPWSVTGEGASDPVPRVSTAREFRAVAGRSPTPDDLAPEAAALADAVCRLPASLRVVLLLRRVAALSAREIAALLEREPEAVRRDEHRALLAIATRLSGRGGGRLSALGGRYR